MRPVIHVALGRVETVDSIARTRAIWIFAIPGLKGDYVCYLQTQYISEVAKPGFSLIKIRHDRIGPGIIRIDIIYAVSGLAIIRSGVPETKRVADLVNIGLICIALDICIAAIPARFNIDKGRFDNSKTICINTTGVIGRERT